MSEPISGTHQYTPKHYGSLVTIKHGAEVMHCSPASVRLAITRQRPPYPVALANARQASVLQHQTLGGFHRPRAQKDEFTSNSC